MARTGRSFLGFLHALSANAAPSDGRAAASVVRDGYRKVAGGG